MTFPNFSICSSSKLRIQKRSDPENLGSFMRQNYSFLKEDVRRAVGVAGMQIVFKVSIAKLNGISLLRREETHLVDPGLLR